MASGRTGWAAAFSSPSTNRGDSTPAASARSHAFSRAAAPCRPDRRMTPQARPHPLFDVAAAVDQTVDVVAVAADRRRLGAQALGRALHDGAMARRHVLRPRRVAALDRAVRVAGDPLAALEDRHQRRRGEHVDPGVRQGTGHRVVMAVDDHMVVGTDGAAQVPLSRRRARPAAAAAAPLLGFEDGSARPLAWGRQRPVVERLAQRRDGGVQLVQPEEGAVAQRRQDPAFDLQHRILHRRLVPRLAGPGRQDAVP